MDNQLRGPEQFRGLPPRKQIAIMAVVAGLALAATLGVFVAESGMGSPASSGTQGKTANFVPTPGQISALHVQTVNRRLFHTLIVTDGYVAANGGFAAGATGAIRNGLPVLAGQSSDVLQAESDLVTAGAQYRAAAANESRQHQLYDSEGAAMKDWQQAQVDLASASAGLSNARSRLRLLGKNDTTISAMERNARGQSPGTFAVGDLSAVWLVANVREADAALVHAGDRVQVRVPAYPQETFQAEITYVASVIDPVTHRLVIGAEVHNAGEKLKPNMTATFTILAGQATDAAAVPESALVYEGNNVRVWVVDWHGNLAQRTITIGRSDGDYMEVTGGLAAGEQIVTNGTLFIDQAVNGI